MNGLDLQLLDPWGRRRGNSSEGKTCTTSTVETVPAGISAYGVIGAYFGRCSPVIGKTRLIVSP